MESITSPPHVIYVLIDPLTQQIRYVGRAKDLKVRIKRHFRGIGHSHVACWIRSLKRLGFKPEVMQLQIVSSLHICEAERHWIAFYRALGCPLTNIGDGGEGGMQGAKHSEETKAKIGAANRGKVVSEETRAKQRARAGSISMETRTKIGISSRNRNPESNARIGEANRRRKITEETRAKIALASQGRPQSEETRKKRSESMKGKPKSPEHREKLRLANLGKKQSRETIEKRLQTRLKNQAPF